MFLEIANNNGTKYIRICESVRVVDPVTNKSLPKKKTIIPFKDMLFSLKYWAFLKILNIRDLHCGWPQIVV